MSAPRTVSPSRQLPQRFTTMALAVVGAVCLVGSYFLPWWNFRLVAPQYPQGLELIVSLTGITGDVEEIDIINHYIGMSHLTDGAVFERAYGGYLVAVLAVAVVVGALAAGRKLGWVAAAFGIGLPIGFIADTSYWLYTFGHDLDPKAPVHIKAFTPTLFGEGKVGQFHTMATPTTGFALALAGVLVLAIAVWVRSRVCRVCPAHDTCNAVCDHGFLTGAR